MDLDRSDHPVTVVRRCVDIVDLLAVALSGQARAALIAAWLRRLDADAVDRLVAASVAPVAVVPATTPPSSRVRALGIAHVVPDDADAAVVASVISETMAVAAAAQGWRATRGFGDPRAATSAPIPPGGSPVADRPPAQRGWCWPCGVRLARRAGPRWRYACR